MEGNNDIFLHELREKSIQVQKLMQNDGEVVSKLCDASETLVWLSEQARKEGLLWLEEASRGERVAGLVLGDELKYLILLIVDGTDPEIVEDISFKRYFSRNYNGMEGFLYLVYLDRVLGIQAGEPPYIFGQNILSFMPDQVRGEMDKIEQAEKMAEAETAEKRWETLYGSLLVMEDDVDFYVIMLLDHCFSALSDEDMKRLLREVDNSDLAMAMKLLGGRSYKKLHDNLSERFRTMIIEDMDHMEPVEVRDVAQADNGIFQIVLKLGAMGEITVPGGLDQIFA